jgi:hypothetical protein
VVEQAREQTGLKYWARLQTIKPQPEFRPNMSTKVLLTMLFVSSAMFAYAEAGTTASHTAPTSISKSDWNTNPAHWDRVIAEQSKMSKLKIGGSDFTVGGSLVEGLHRRPPEQNRSLGRRILGLPVVRLFVPQPMPYPPGGGKYFRWGESDRPWASLSEASDGTKSADPVKHESQVILISIGR